MQKKCSYNIVVGVGESVNSSPYLLKQQLSLKRGEGPLVKLLKVMRILCFLLLSGFLANAAVSHSQTVSLNAKKVQPKWVFKEVERQTGMAVFGSLEILSKMKPITVSVVNLPVLEFLSVAFQDQNLHFAIQDKTILITEVISQPATPINLSMLSPDNFKEISGIVNDANGQPIANASIIVIGQKRGTNADGAGKFSLSNISEKAQLSITSVGYKTITISLAAFTKEGTINKPGVVGTLADGKLQLSITLAEEVDDLEVVEVSTGVFKRPVQNFTGAAKTITAQELKKVSATNILAALGALDPAFQMPENINLGSDPNRLPDIELRGQNNFPIQDNNSNVAIRNKYAEKPNSPMFVLDGFQVSLERIFDLDMNRVETVTILKDAAATSIYGSRASNGVVIIETRQPKPGTVRLSYRGGLGLTMPDLRGYDLLDAREKLEFEKEIGFYTYTRERQFAQTMRDEEYNERLKDVTNGVNTYWLSQPLSTGVSNNHSLYLEGGDQAVRYGVSLGYFNEKGVMKGSSRTKYNGGVNLSYKSSKLLFRNDFTINSVRGDNSLYGSFSDYSKLNQYWKPYGENGKPLKYLGNPRENWDGGQIYFTYANPLYNASLPGKNYTSDLSFTNNFNLEYTATRWLKFVAAFGLTKGNGEEHVYISSLNTIFDRVPVAEKGSYDLTKSKQSIINGSVGFDIRKQWARNLIFVTGSAEIRESNENALLVKAVGFPNEKVAEIVFSSLYSPNSKPIGYLDVARLGSARFNANYSFDNKYLFDFSTSLDASSKFGSEKRWAPFWSAGIGWNLHREEALMNSKVVNYLKLRASIGTTGDQNFSPYNAISTYSYFSDQYYLNYLSAYLLGYGNKMLGWQKGFKRNIGLDASVMDERINLSADYYFNTTDNLLLDITTPPSLGFTTYKENAGSIKNTGWQVSLNYSIIQQPRNGIYWRIGVGAVSNKNTINKISNALTKINEETNAQQDQKLPKLYFEEGQSLTAIWAVRSLGIDPSNGMEMFLTKDGRSTYVWSANDKVPVGDSRAKVSGTINTGLDYKNFSINLYMSYRLGGYIYNQTLVDRVENIDVAYNVDRRVAEKRWKQPGDITEFKGIVSNTGLDIVTSPTLATSRFVQKENLLDATNASISYLLNEKWTKGARLSNTRIEFYMVNPFRISSIKRERGLDYPFAQTYTINISTNIF